MKYPYGRGPIIILSSVVSVVFVWSAVRPHDYFTWLLEVIPAIIGAGVLASTYQKFRLTRLAYVLICMHMIILMIGGHYTYAGVPLFNWFRDAFGFSRNHYDRLGHFAQGFVPAIIAREILLRTSPLRQGKWLFFIVTAICLAISASYELMEWFVAVTTGTAADAFLGTQGDVWDSQWDMFFALCGAIISQVLLKGLHDRELEEII